MLHLLHVSFLWDAAGIDWTKVPALMALSPPHYYTLSSTFFLPSVPIFNLPSQVVKGGVLQNGHTHLASFFLFRQFWPHNAPCEKHLTAAWNIPFYTPGGEVFYLV